MDFEKTVLFCKNWFAENNINVPNTAKEWSKGRSGVSVPPLCTYQSLRTRNIKVGDLLEAINPSYYNRVKNDQKNFDFLSRLGLEFLGTEDKETVYFRCKKCKIEDKALKSTLRRWESAEKRFCSVCRKESGKQKSLAYYQSYLNPTEYLVEKKEGGRLFIKHLKCKNTFTRSRGYIAGNQRADKEHIYCPFCTKQYTKGRVPGFLSFAEKQCIEYLQELQPSLNIQREVPYSSLIDTDRKFILDVWIPEYSLGIEITSKNNKLPLYQDRLREKLNLAKEHYLNIVVATSKSDIEDIVRTLSKGRE